MNKNDIIEMFEKGNSKEHIINTVFNSKKTKNSKYTKQDAQEYVEMILTNWWKTIKK